MPETIRSKNITKRYKLMCHMQDIIPSWQRNDAPLYKKVVSRYHKAFDKWDEIENENKQRDMPQNTIQYIKYLYHKKQLFRLNAILPILSLIELDIKRSMGFYK